MQESNALERFKKVDAPFYQPSKQGGHTTVTDSGMILQSMNIPLQETIFETDSKKRIWAIQALEELRRIREEVQSKTFSQLWLSSKRSKQAVSCLMQAGVAS